MPTREQVPQIPEISKGPVGAVEYKVDKHTGLLIFEEV